MADEAPEKVGRYEIVRAVGKGAMGVVYEGRDPAIGRRVAIKMCRTDVMASDNLRDEILKRFERELRATGALQHPNIITIYDVGAHDGAPYIAMEFIEGGDLRQIIDNPASYPIETRLDIAAKVCEALHAAHRIGIIHRDIKPANILLPASGGVKVADFGIARVPDSELTIDGAIVGTPNYMSPEQFSGDPLDGRSDLFSVGIILYEMLTGEKPFPGEALSTVMHQVLRREPATPSTLNPELPPAVDRVVLKALAKRPDDRYADGTLMAAALREACCLVPREDVLLGKSPRKAETLIGNTRPAAPEPEAPVLPTDSSASTLNKGVHVAITEDETASILWPAVAVVVFAALVIAAIALRLQLAPAPPADGKKPPSASAPAPSTP